MTDCVKLARSGFVGKCAILIYGFEDEQRPLGWLIEAFEAVAARTAMLGPRHQAPLRQLVHPVFAAGQVYAWKWSETNDTWVTSDDDWSMRSDITASAQSVWSQFWSRLLAFSSVRMGSLRDGSAGHGRCRPAVNRHQQTWKACWWQRLASSNLASSARALRPADQVSEQRISATPAVFPVNGDSLACLEQEFLLPCAGRERPVMPRIGEIVISRSGVRRYVVIRLSWHGRAVALPVWSWGH